MQADARGIRRLERRADVKAPADVVGGQCGNACRAGEVGQARIYFLHAHTRANGKRRAHLIRNRGLNIDRFDRGFQRQQLPAPTGIVVGGQTERHIQRNPYA